MPHVVQASHPGPAFTTVPRWTPHSAVNSVRLEELHRVTGQTLHRAILRGSDVVYLEKLPGRRGVTTPALIGDQLPANCTAVGKALLAFADDAVTADVASAPLRRRTAGSLASIYQLLDQLDAIRHGGFATDREESAVGLRA
jgi:DNA-binding IclR family transcriptional regulator